MLPLQDAYTANCGCGAEQFFLPDLPEDAEEDENGPGNETCSAARYVQDGSEGCLTKGLNCPEPEK